MALPTPPGERMAYDRDGSIPFGGADGFVPDGAGGSYVKFTNSECVGGTGTITGPFLSSNGGTFDVFYGLIFPEPRDVVGVFWQCDPFNVGAGNPSVIEVSTDTTDGTDGTWTTVTSSTDPGDAFNPEPSNYGSTVVPDYRSSIVDLTSLALTGIIGIRMFLQSSFQKAVQTLHVYGQPSTGENLDSLRFWQDPTDVEVTGGYFDFGDTTGGGIYTIDFRVKNISSTHTANSVSISAETLSDASPTLISQFLLSQGGAYSEVINVGTMPPGTVTGTLTIQLTVDASAQTGACELRLVALPSSWT